MIKSHELFSILDLALSHVGATFTIDDLKAVRRTCKGLKRLVDPWFRKIEIDMADYSEADTRALASSSLLKNIRELAIFSSYGCEMDPEDYYELHKKNLLSILAQCSPQLELLKIHTVEEYLEPSVFSRLLQDYQFPKLKTVSLFALTRGTLKVIQSALFSMTSLEKLFLSDDPEIYDAMVTVEDLEIISQAPFLENLTDLTLCLDTYTYAEPLTIADPAFTPPLASIVSRISSKMKRLTIAGTSSLQMLSDTPLENLEELFLDYCAVPEVFSLPRSLVHLRLEGLNLGAPDEFVELFTSGHLCRLKTLKMIYVSDRIDAEEFIFREGAIQRFNLPMVESIDLDHCIGHENDVFGISEAATTLPNLKKYVVKGSLTQQLIDPHLVRRFFASYLAANLEEFAISYVNLGYDGFKALVE